MVRLAAQILWTSWFILARSFQINFNSLLRHMQFVDNWEQYSASEESCKAVTAEGADPFYGDIRFRTTPDDGDTPVTIALYTSIDCDEYMPFAIIRFYTAPGYDQIVVPEEIDPDELNNAFYLRLTGWKEWRVIDPDSPEWDIVEGVRLQPGEVALESMLNGWVNAGSLVVEFGPILPDVDIKTLGTDMPAPSKFTGQRAVRYMKSPPEDDLEGFAPRFWRDSAACAMSEELAPDDEHEFNGFKKPFTIANSITQDEEWELFSPQNTRNGNQNNLVAGDIDPDALGSLTSFEKAIIE
ncbi:hypothetical protein TWF694_004723 [Orbilia ellipsospora]|uniref:Uncharacterized protein n=1 Tax=Orbilia ellipsospora TaxID=2528407 RepID=A0AAV9WW09_9PEZI